mmetsp:Transcript_26647/g.74488  ORF Transcript_26647/g.74488 Transcript_26647/m.74488 type:complete len:249 (+) Transcript_26647:78-824(+)
MSERYGDEKPLLEDQYDDEGDGYGPKYFLSPGQLLATPFVIGQTLFNIVASFCGPLFFFWIIFHKLPSAKPCYAWYSGEVLGPVVITPLASSILALAWAPIGIPDALPKRWFAYVRERDVSTGPLSFVWFLRYRYGILRHCMMGLLLSCVAIPIMLALVVFIFAESDSVYGDRPDDPGSAGLPAGECYNGQLTAWTQTFVSVTYIGILPIIIIPLGLLGFAVEPNLDRVNKIFEGKNIILKGLYSPLC